MARALGTVALLGLAAWAALLAPAGAEVTPEDCSALEDNGKCRGSGTAMLQKQGRAAIVPVPVEEEQEGEEVRSKHAGTPAPTPSPATGGFCGQGMTAEEINGYVVPPREVQRLLNFMLGAQWGIGYPNATKACRGLPLDPQTHYITLSVGQAVLQGAAAEKRKLDAVAAVGEVVSTWDSFRAIKGAFDAHAFCIALRMCSSDPATAAATWLKQFTFGFHHENGITIYTKGVVSLKFHALAFSNAGELHVARLKVPLWGYGGAAAPEAPVKNLHWWLQLSADFPVIDKLKAITAKVKGTLGAHVEADGERDIARFLANMVAEQDGTIEKFKESMPERYHARLLGTVAAELSFDLKKLFGPAFAKSNTDEGQLGAPANLFKVDADASFLREARVDPTSRGRTYLAHYFSARLRADLAEFLTVSDFFQDLLAEWAASPQLSVQLAFYTKVTLSKRVELGFRISGRVRLSCGFLKGMPAELLSAFPDVQTLRNKFCQMPVGVDLDLVATHNQLDWSKSCLHIGDHHFCLDRLPTCPHPVQVGGKCSRNEDCTGAEYGPLGKGYCKPQDGLATAFCSGRCEKLAPTGGSCSSEATNSAVFLVENEKCEAHYQGASPACVCDACTDARGKLADGSRCQSNDQCKNNFCDWGKATHTSLCDGTCRNARRALGEACNWDNDCRSGHCSGWVFSRHCVECESSHHCGGNQYCHNNQCRDKVADGKAADSYWMCKSNTLRCGTCGKSAKGGPCTWGSDCKSGHCNQCWGLHCGWSCGGSCK